MFVDLLYSNVREPETTDTQLRVGSGVRIETTDVDHRPGGYNATDNQTDFAINGNGFFAVKNPRTNEIFYTRDGSFKQSRLNFILQLRTDNFYLTGILKR